MIKKLFNCFTGLIFFTSVVTAQAPGYAFQAASGTYTALVGGTTVTFTYNGAANNDDGITTPANAIPIGFTFNYNGTNYTTIKPCANGWASFSATALTNNTDTWTNNLTSGPAANQRPFIAPLWDDMDMGGGVLSYQLSGSAPTRVLTIEWANAHWDYNATIGVMSFQIKLYETTNIIEFVYRQEGGSIAANSGGASIGISATGTGSNTFLSLSDAGTAPTVSSTVETTNILIKPATGQIYRWIPYCSASATNTTGEKISNFTYNTINNNTASTAGYVNFANVSTTASLFPTSSLPFSTTVSSFAATDQVVMFIDFNHNGDFSDPGETIFTSTLPLSSGTVAGTINIPAISSTVLQGPTRLRIRLHDTGNGPNATSCGTSTAGQVQDYTVNIQPCFAAVITSQPPNTIVCNGGGGSIAIGTTGTGLTYQWQLSTDGGANYNNISNGANYSGVTTNTLVIAGAILSMNNYKYKVIINGTCTASNIASNAATLTVNTAGAITSNPSHLAVCVGKTASFIAAASGSSPSYQWQVSTDGGINYSDLSGATSATLTLTNVPIGLNGNRYRCVATVTSCGPVTSSYAILTVNPLPVVTLSIAPISQLKPGMDTYVTTGTVPGATNYSWTLNGTSIPGAITNTILADVNGLGKYQATVTDINGCVNTSPILEITALVSERLFIYPNPSNGQFQIRLYSPWLSDIRTLSIYNAAGVLVARKDFEINNSYMRMDFDLRWAAPGFYTVRIVHRYVNRIVTGKFLIQ